MEDGRQSSCFVDHWTESEPSSVALRPHRTTRRSRLAKNAERREGAQSEIGALEAEMAALELEQEVQNTIDQVFE